MAIWRGPFSVRNPGANRWPVKFKDANGTVLPLEEPPKNPFIKPAIMLAIVCAAWQPDPLSALRTSVVTLDNTPAAAVVLAAPQVKINSRTIADQWQFNWNTQRKGPLTPSGFDRVPTHAPVVPAAIAYWQPPELSALRVSTATLDNPPAAAGVPFVRVPRTELASWEVSWAAQRRPIALTPSGFDTVPPRAPTVPSAVQYWQPPALTAIRVSTATLDGGAAAAVDNPPIRSRDAKVELQAWQPPEYGRYVSGTMLPRADFPPPRRDYLPVSILSSWVQDWAAQGHRPTVTQGAAAAQVDNPPPHSLFIPFAISSWQPPELSAIRVSTATLNGTWTNSTVDDPPVRSRVPRIEVQAWQPPDYGVYASATILPRADFPVPRRDYLPATVLVAWQVDWQSQRRLVAVTQGIPPPQVDNPPTKSLYQPHWLISQWQVTWQTQTTNPNSSWNYVPPPGNLVVFLDGVSFRTVGDDGVQDNHYILTPVGGGFYNVVKAGSESDDKTDSVSHEEYIIT